MTYLEQIQRGVDFIEGHLEDRIDLTRVSRAAGISHAHFQRVFRVLTGDTLKSYVRARRMANALDLLLDTDRRILDVSVAAGFESQEAFARAFRRTFGSTPSQVRRLGHGKLFLKKLRLDALALDHVSRSISLEPEMVERPATLTAGLRTVFHGPGSDKNNLGDKLPALWGAFVPRASELPDRVDSPYYGVVGVDASDPERLEYVAAVEVRSPDTVPADMVTLTIPAGQYAVFEHRGPTRTLDRTVDYIYATWLARSRLRHTWGPDLELYGPRWSPTGTDSVMHYAIPVAE